jgi:SEC-C motif domain protein
MATQDKSTQGDWPRPGDDDRCPCLSGETFGECCAPLILGKRHAPTAERLMRSRYTSFAIGDTRYLLATWDPATRPESLELDPSIRWYRLDIVRTSAGGPFDSDGIVEFRAHYRLGRTSGEQHETSHFHRVDRRWLFVT